MNSRLSSMNARFCSSTEKENVRKRQLQNAYRGLLRDMRSLRAKSPAKATSSPFKTRSPMKNPSTNYLSKNIHNDAENDVPGLGQGFKEYESPDYNVPGFGHGVEEYGPPEDNIVKDQLDAAFIAYDNAVDMLRTLNPEEQDWSLPHFAELSMCPWFNGIRKAQPVTVCKKKLPKHVKALRAKENKMRKSNAMNDEEKHMFWNFEKGYTEKRMLEYLGFQANLRESMTEYQLFQSPYIIQAILRMAKCDGTLPDHQIQSFIDYRELEHRNSGCTRASLFYVVMAELFSDKMFNNVIAKDITYLKRKHSELNNADEFRKVEAMYYYTVKEAEVWQIPEFVPQAIHDMYKPEDIGESGEFLGATCSNFE